MMSFILLIKFESPYFFPNILTEDKQIINSIIGVSFIIYTDFTTLLKKIYILINNPIIRHTAKLIKKNLCLYSILT